MCLQRERRRAERVTGLAFQGGLRKDLGVGDAQLLGHLVAAHDGDGGERAGREGEHREDRHGRAEAASGASLPDPAAVDVLPQRGGHLGCAAG